MSMLSPTKLLLALALVTGLLALAFLGLAFAAQGQPVALGDGWFAVGAALLLAATIAALVVARTRPAPSADGRVELLSEGMQPGDQALVEALFPRSDAVRLRAIQGGFSGAAVLEAQSWGAGRQLQRSSVVKLGSSAKLQPEIDNYAAYVREYVGNTAQLLGSHERNGRVALRWTYAGLSGTGIRTLADVANAGEPLAPLIDRLFAHQNTLGLLIGTPQREPARRLYADYAWSGRDWERITRAAADVLGTSEETPTLPFEPQTPNPLPIVARWMGLDGGAGERLGITYDVPVTTVHGDLNSRNVLIDGSGDVFVIDFAHTGPGHLLRDFARLETELLLVLAQQDDEHTLNKRVELAETLMQAADGRPATTLRDVLQQRGQRGQRAEAVARLRHHAHDYSGPWLGGPAEPYLLALLYSTLDTLRYAQCTIPAKRAALRIAGRLCQHLDEAQRRSVPAYPVVSGV